jgi:hypothetical protein
MWTPSATGNEPQEQSDLEASILYTACMYLKGRMPALFQK